MEQDLIILSQLILKQDKNSVAQMMKIYNKYNDVKLTGCTCNSRIRLKNRKAVIDWYNELNNPTTNDENN